MKHQEFSPDMEGAPASTGGLPRGLELQLWESQETCCQEFHCGPALDPLWALPQGCILAGYGDEVICGVFHADRMRAGPQTEGRKLKGSLVVQRPGLQTQHTPYPRPWGKQGGQGHWRSGRT